MVGRWRTRRGWLQFVAAAMASTVWAAEPSPAQRREAILRLDPKEATAAAQLAAGLKDDSAVVRRTAVRIMADAPAACKPHLAAALANDDPIVRRTALSAIVAAARGESLPHLDKALGDKDPLVRQAAVGELVALSPRTPEILELLKRASQDEVAAVRGPAGAALWPFHREVVLLRDRKDWDHEIKLVQKIALPKDGWRFATDPKADGHVRNWFDPTFDDGKWKRIAVDRAWEQSGVEYDGIAWYRLRFHLPARPDHNAVEMHFEAVDETAWVWVNGQYVGQHDLGTAGWDKPFNLDITREVKWDGTNHLTVRVLDRAHAGGIWKPVEIEIYK